jgi:hypothetical protein
MIRAAGEPLAFQMTTGEVNDAKPRKAMTQVPVTNTTWKWKSINVVCMISRLWLSTTMSCSGGRQPKARAGHHIT